MSKCLWLMSGAVAFVFVASVPFVALAEHTEEEKEHKEVERMTKQMPLTNRSFVGLPNQLGINPTGEVKSHGGVIHKIDGTSLEVMIWGLEFRVDASHVDVSSLNEGDQVMIVGRINPNTGVITAQLIKGPNSTQDNSIVQLQAKIQELIRRLEMMKAAGLRPVTN